MGKLEKDKIKIIFMIVKVKNTEGVFGKFKPRMNTPLSEPVINNI